MVKYNLKIKDDDSVIIKLRKGNIRVDSIVVEAIIDGVAKKLLEIDSDGELTRHTPQGFY